MAVGSELPHLGGYPFEVRYSDGALVRATAAADVAADAYVYFSRLFSAVEPDIAVVVADEADWPSAASRTGCRSSEMMPARSVPAIVVMPAGGGDFWIAMAQDLRDASPRGYAKLLATYPDGAGGLDLQPFFDLITIHELGHAFEGARRSAAPDLLAQRDLRQPGHARVRRNPAAGEPADARGAPNRGSGKSKACRSDARRGLQHARGAASPLHGF